ncbi:hypothetical protein PFISCL1PPCAC_27570, partial [Pristionchus fissidentatus]
PLLEGRRATEPPTEISFSSRRHSAGSESTCGESLTLQAPATSACLKSISPDRSGPICACLSGERVSLRARTGEQTPWMRGNNWPPAEGGYKSTRVYTEEVRSAPCAIQVSPQMLARRLIEKEATMISDTDIIMRFYYENGIVTHGELVPDENGKVLFALPKPAVLREEPINKDLDVYESEEEYTEHLKKLVEEGVFIPSKDDDDVIFWMDEEIGFVMKGSTNPDNLHVPEEMPEEMIGIVPYEDLIPAGLRSRRSGNERVHPSELRTANGDALRARRERDNLFEMDMSEEEEEEQADNGDEADSESEERDERESIAVVADVARPVEVISIETAVLAAPTLPEPSMTRRSLFTRKTCTIPANQFRCYRMARREMELARELAADPRTPRALDDDEFEAVVQSLQLNNENVSSDESEEFDPSLPSTSSSP